MIRNESFSNQKLIGTFPATISRKFTRQASRMVFEHLHTSGQATPPLNQRKVISNRAETNQIASWNPSNTNFKRIDKSVYVLQHHSSSFILSMSSLDCFLECIIFTSTTTLATTYALHKMRFSNHLTSQWWSPVRGEPPHAKPNARIDIQIKF